MIYLILAAILYTAAILIATTASRNANTNLVAAVTNLTSLIAPAILIMPALAKKSVSTQKYGLWMAALSGLIIGLYVLVLNKALTENKVGIVAPIVYGGTIFLSTVLSYFIYKERLTLLEGLGGALILAGLIVIVYARATVN